MGFLSRIFGNKKSHNPLDELPPLYGGDASSPSTPVVVNCASMNSANIFINHFIKEKHGEQGTAWERGVEYFVDEEGIPEGSIRAIVVELADGTFVKYYFDISRPMNVAKKFMKPLFDQIEQKPSKAQPRTIPTSVIAHMLDPNTGYVRHQMVVGQQIDAETVEKFAEGENIFVLVAYEKGVPKHIICKREMWEQQKAAFDAIDSAGRSATKDVLDRLRNLDNK